MFPIYTTFVIYIGAIFAIGIISYFYTKNLTDYMLGGRSLHGAVAALGAGASDMSSWLMLALPGAVMAFGLNQIWLPIGLAVGAYLNWQFIAKRLRVYTEVAKDSITIPAYFENRFHDFKGRLRVITALVILIFFTFYTAAGFVAGGLLFSNTFGVDYTTGLWITAGIILVYTCVGGFLAISWIDFFQGSLMFLALLVVPLVVLYNLGGVTPAMQTIYHLSPSYFDVFKGTTLIGTISLLAWGLGYFGQPHILVRFMAIKDPNEVPKAQFICMTWMCIALLGAVFVGFLGIAFYAQSPLSNPETVFIAFANTLFNPWISGILLAAVLSAIMSTASAQLLASSSALVEDFYRKFFRPQSSHREQLITGRVIVVLITLVAVALAADPTNSSILALVGYAWAGLGAAFGPVILLSLFWSRMTLKGAMAGIISGALVVIVWSQLKTLGGIFSVYELLPAFIISTLAIIIVTMITARPEESIMAQHREVEARLV